MWPFGSKGPVRDRTIIRELLQRLTDVEIRAMATQQQLEALRAQHVSLRGRVYATGLHKGPQEELHTHVAVTQKPTLMELGFTPGKPFPHK